MPVRFAAPAYLFLLLLVPLFIYIARYSFAGLSGFRKWAAYSVRGFVLLCLIFALAEMQWVKFGRNLTVFFLADQSASIPPGSRRDATEFINQSVTDAGKDDQAGLVLFGADAGLEKFPQPIGSARGWFGRSTLVIDREQTDISGAVRLALAAFPENTRRRIVLVSDGCENAGIVQNQLDAAKSLNCPIDVRVIDYDHNNEVLVEKALIPSELRTDEPFDLRVVIRSLQNCTADLTLTMGRKKLLSGETIKLEKGKSVHSIPFPEGLSEPGPYTFDVSLVSAADTIRENNTAVAYTWVKGKKRQVLLVDSNPQDMSYLKQALTDEDMQVDVLPPNELPATATALRKYDSVVLSNVPASSLSTTHMATIEAAVKELGMGLVLLGGEHSFGPGGYQNTPLEACSPLDYDIRQKRVMPKGAIVLAMDAAEDPNGNRWAIEMASASLKVLSFHDEFGIFSGGRWVFSLTELQDKSAAQAAIDGMIVSDFDDFESQLNAALVAFQKSTAAAKHVVIMTDGGHGAYRPSNALQQKLRAQNITVSTVVFHPHPGTEKAVVAGLSNLANSNNGRFYYPRSPDELPQIFFKEAAMIARSLIHEEPFQPAITGSGTDPVSGFDSFPQLKGYVLTTPKARAQVPIVRTYFDTKLDEKINDPILAHWNYGLGKVVAFTSDAKNRWAAQWVGWSGFKKFWPQVIRWSLPAAPIGSATVRSNIDIQDNKARLSVDVLDGDGAPVNFLDLKGSVLTPKKTAEGTFETRDLSLQQTGPGRYEADFLTGSPGVYFVSLSYEGANANGEEISGLHTTAAAVPYSLEYKSLSANVPLLKQIAEKTGGRVLTDEMNVFDHNTPAAAASQPAWPLLLLLAVVVFPADVGVRKVLIDWHRVMEKIIEKLTGLRPQKKEPEVVHDPGMARLLSRKKKTRQEIFSPTADAASDHQQDFAARPDAPQKAAPDAQKEQPKPEVNSYTQRLIQAKKRAKKEE